MPAHRPHPFQKAASIGRQKAREKAFRECPYCGYSVHYKSYRTHMLEHGEMNAQHIKGAQDEGFDPLHIRVENLKKTISRLESKPRLSKADSDLLAEYRSGMTVLTQRLQEETHGV